MNKRIWIYIAIGLFIVLVIFGFVWYFSQPAAKAPSGGQGALPSYILDPKEEARAAGFVKNFVSLYNTYSQGDYSNLYAVGSYETPGQQTRTIAYIKQLETSTPVGHEIRTNADSGKFSYTYPKADTLLTQVTASVSETQGEQTQNYSISAKLTLLQDGRNWRVDEISIIKQP